MPSTSIWEVYLVDRSKRPVRCPLTSLVSLLSAVIDESLGERAGEANDKGHKGGSVPT